MSCLFCDIAAGAAPAHRVWESASHLAFLSIFPNTAGVTVVIPKEHLGSYLFDATEAQRDDLLKATSQVARLLEAAFDDVGRTGLVFEGFGIDHLHAKLFPLHGTVGEWRNIASSVRTYFKSYEGYISSHDGVRADDAELKALAARIRAADARPGKR
jgi:histidine triad (HIT) family protein